MSKEDHERREDDARVMRTSRGQASAGSRGCGRSGQVLGTCVGRRQGSCWVHVDCGVKLNQIHNVLYQSSAHDRTQ